MKKEDLLKGIKEKGERLQAIRDACIAENRVKTDEEKTEWDKLTADIRAFNGELTDLEEKEKLDKEAAEFVAKQKKIANQIASDLIEDGEGKELDGIAKKVDQKAVLRYIAGIEEKIEGAESEMNAEGKAEFERFGIKTNRDSFNVPARYLEGAQTRADITSVVPPTFTGPYVDALRENAVYSKVIPGGNILMSQTGDLNIIGVGAQTLGWKGEGVVAVDGGTAYTEDTLTPTRLTGFSPLSHELLIQNGEIAYQMVLRDLGRETANKLDAAMFSTAAVTGAPTSLGATGSVGTFTEAATYSANSTIFADFLTAEQTLLDAKAIQGKDLWFIAATNLFTDLIRTALVSSVSSAATNAPIDEIRVRGYRTVFTTACTSSAGTSGDFYMGNFAHLYYAQFGGASFIRDEATDVKEAITNIVVHRWVDWGTIRPAAFVKATTLVA